MLFSELNRPRTRSGPSPIGILGSLAAHATFFLWAFAWSPSSSKSDYDVLIKPRETHLVWYNFKRKLPNVSPASPAAERRPLKAEAIAPQSIVASPPDAPRAPQMIFHPVPRIQPQPEAALPNIIALSAPPPAQREFVPPAPIARKAADAHIAGPDTPPELKAEATAPFLPVLPKVARPFTPPPVRNKPKLEWKVELADVPQLETGNRSIASSAEKALVQGARTLAFRPRETRVSTASVGAMPDTPLIPNASPSTANVAVVGLNPMDSLKVPLPQSSRPAQFSAGPKLNPDGVTATGRSSGITVPNLTVRGGEPSATPNLIARTMSSAYNAPSSIESLRGGAKEGTRHLGGPLESASDIKRAGTRVSGAPDPRFLGRQVFSVAIQSPNLTSHEGSWLMWYADRAELAYRAAISAPEPLHKVDPKYISTAAEEHVQGTVRLAFVITSDGRVYGVETVKSVDVRLDRSAIEALKKWEFSPAMREGKPIDVDALVEIPFRLAPPAPK